MNQLVIASDKNPQLNIEANLGFNPICKSTYEALPKIYGNYKYQRKRLLQKRRHIEKKNLTRHCCQNNEHKQHQLQTSFENKKTKMSKNVVKVSFSSHRLSQPKIIQCTKKFCQCNIRIQREEKNSSANARKNNKILNKRLPPLLNIDPPDDMQSQHKVLMKNMSIISPTGLDILINYNQRQSLRSNTQGNPYNCTINGEMHKNQIDPKPQQSNNEPKMHYQSYDQSTQQNKIIHDKNLKIFKKKNLKNKLRYKTYLDEASESNSDHQSSEQLKKPDSRLKQRQIRSSSKSSVESGSISSLLFQHSKKQHTMFYDNSKKIQQISKKSKIRSIKSNGLFTIPQENQYVDYLKNYKPLNAKFNLKALLKMDKFGIRKEDQGVYFGEVQDNKKQGLGIFVSEKDIFQGNWQKNIRVRGYERNIDGVYEGQFVNGLRSGQGTFKWNNGQVFNGEWKEGTKNGYGIWKSPKGDMYEGQWVKNRQNGKGTFKHKNNIYIGQFKDFLKHGQGSENFENGDSYNGQYKDGKPHGKGKYKWSDGKQYIGGFINGLRQGKGLWKDPNGSIYEGDFFEDYKEGYGIQTLKSGERFEGYFEEGIKKKGKIYDRNGNVIEVE